MNPTTEFNSQANQMFTIFILGALGIFGIGMVAYFYAKQEAEKRRAGLEAMAATMGLTYVRQCLPNAFIESLKSMVRWFRFGNNRSVQSYLHGIDSRQTNWYIFDFTCEESSGENSTTHTYTVFIAQTQLNLPVLELNFKNLGHSINKLFGLDYIELTSPGSGQKYAVSTKDMERSQKLLDSGLGDVLMASPSLHWNLGGPFVIGRCNRLAVEQIESQLKLVERVVDHLLARD